MVAILMCLPLFLGWLIITLASNLWMLYLGRIVTGFAAASFSVIAPLFIRLVKHTAKLMIFSFRW